MSMQGLRIKVDLEKEMEKNEAVQGLGLEDWVGSGLGGGCAGGEGEGSKVIYGPVSLVVKGGWDSGGLSDYGC